MKKNKIFLIVILLILKAGIISAQILNPLSDFKHISIKYFKYYATETKQFNHYNEEEYAKRYIFVLKVVELNEQTECIYFSIINICNLSIYDEINPFVCIK